MATSTLIFIKGTTEYVMPTPKIDGFKISKNKIWSDNTRRNDRGNMVGTLIAVKDKLQIEWPPLTGAQCNYIDSIVSDVNYPFVGVKYTNLSGNVTQINAYFGDVTYPVYGLNINGKIVCKGVAVNAIQQ